MLQRQQASAVIDARKMIVEGAVGMVEMALEKLSENQIVELDEERKAQMVSQPHGRAVQQQGRPAGGQQRHPILTLSPNGRPQGGRSASPGKPLDPSPRVCYHGIYEIKEVAVWRTRKKQRNRCRCVCPLPCIAKSHSGPRTDFRSINGQIEFLLTEAVRKRKKRLRADEFEDKP